MGSGPPEAKELHIGVVGAGAFARFATRAFLQAPGIKVVAVTDIDLGAARQMGKEMELTVFDTMAGLVADGGIHLVYIATPPFLHYAQSKMALLAGKHVVCEKPAALRISEAEELASLARSCHLLYVVNLMQRYNPLFEKVRRIIEEKLLGDFRHGFFENYASDEHLQPGHWFWDRSSSGGIFIEHGVHFFDLFAGWLGEGKVVGAWEWERPGICSSGNNARFTDRVQATVMYKSGIVNFYHGFNQPDLLDRQEMRLQFDRGDITLSEWVPVSMRLHGLLQRGQLSRLQEIIGESRVVYHRDPKTVLEPMTGRWAGKGYEDHITLAYANPLGKQHLYKNMLCAMISDQRQKIEDPGHMPVIDDHNAIRSLRIAEEATLMAEEATRLAENA